MKISGVVIAKNAGKTIEKTLKSLSWCDEIIVINNNSSDNTRMLAQKLGARSVSATGDFSKLRNIGAKSSSFDWLLYVDTDEIITNELKSEIKKIIDDKYALSAYAIPRKNILLGKEMKYGGWAPDYVLRLIKKNDLIRWEGKLHEQPKIKGKKGKLKNRLIHNTHTSLKSMISKTNEWSSIEAQLIYDSKHPKIKPWRFISIGIREFWDRGIKKFGFLDGVIGIIEIIYQIFNKFIVYAKVWELQQEKVNNGN